MSTRPPLADLTRTIAQREALLRASLRASAKKVFPGFLQAFEPRFTGKAFVDEMGLLVDFVNGEAETFYVAAGLPLRDAHLRQMLDARRRFFDGILAGLPPQLRVLDIGAGGDVAPIEAFQALGHEVVCTDASLDTVAELRCRVNAPMFACDLIDLPRIVDSQSFDVVFGNSTLGYIAPRKLRAVVENVVGVMRLGGVFTFDLTPLPSYFQAVEDGAGAWVANESSFGPDVLLDLIARFGPKQGVHAAAYCDYLRLHTLQLGMLKFLEQAFGGHGLRAIAAQSPITVGKAHLSAYTLRVAREAGPVLSLSPGESPLDYDELRNTHAPPDYQFRFVMVDRQQGVEIARALGQPEHPRESAWQVAAFITATASIRALDAAVRASVLESTPSVTWRIR